MKFIFFPQKMLLICSWSDSQSSCRDYVHVFMYSFIEKAEAEDTASITWASVCVVNHVCKNVILIFTDTNPYSILFHLTDLLLIYYRKFCKFRDIPRYTVNYICMTGFHLDLPHCRNHRALKKCDGMIGIKMELSSLLVFCNHNVVVMASIGTS